MQDFFISYNKADVIWATGIGDWLDQAGFTIILQTQDFVPGSNFVSEMHRALQTAQRLIMVLSPDYLRAKFPEAEWTAAFASDPTNEKRNLVPVRVRDCQPPGLLKPIVYIDLVGLSAGGARERFLTGIAACLKGKDSNHRPTARRFRSAVSAGGRPPDRHRKQERPGWRRFHHVPAAAGPKGGNGAQRR